MSGEGQRETGPGGMSLAMRRVMPNLEALAIAGMAFVLPAFNGRPARFSDGYYCWAALICIWVYRAAQKRAAAIPPTSVFLVAAWFCWFLAATAAALANPDGGVEMLASWTSSYLLPFLLLLTFVGSRMSEQQSEIVVLGLCVGVIGRFAYAALVFYHSWGIPSLSTLVLAHFNLLRILPYEEATFGNTANTASLIVPLAVFLGLAAISMRLSLLTQVLVGLALVMLGVNGLITGSRAFVFVTALGLGLGALKLNLRAVVPILVLLAIGYVFLSSHLGAANLSRFGAVATSQVARDSSLTERVLSIQSGLQTMADHPLGVGPGMAYKHIAYSAAHQFAVNQGAETGPIGMAAVIALSLVVLAKCAKTRCWPQAAPDFAFKFGALAWFIMAMTADSPTGYGPEVPWVGIVVLFAAMGEMTAGATASPSSVAAAAGHRLATAAR